MIQFINTVHPDDTTSAHSLSLIRSHVAKHSRALQRQQKQARSLPKGRSTRQKTRSRQQEVEEEEEGSAYETTLQRPSNRRAAAKTELRTLAPKSKQRALTLVPKTAGPPSTKVSSPLQLIGGARKDAYQGFARPLSEDEDYLFDFFVNYVILNGYKQCHHKEDEISFQRSMRELWLPFAMAQPSLMAALFHVACRHYAATTSNENTNKFAIKKLQYRVTCLSMAKDAITSEDVASDATIALALLMASESYMEGDIDAFYTHGSGIIQMVTARGGLETLGISGFLTKIVGWSIYNTRNHFIAGPDEAELSN